MYDAVPGYRDKSKDQLLKLDSIDSLKCMSNHVLIRIDDRHDEITYGTLTLKLDTSYEVGKHAENKGVVVKVPDRYIYSEKPSLNTGDWDTDIEIQPGDQVWFDYLTGIECNKIECEEKLYYVLPYHVLYVAKRKEGNIGDKKWVTPVKKGDRFEFLEKENKKGFVFYQNEVHLLDEDDNFYKIIPLNGYVLLNPIMYTDKFIDFELEREDGKYATVAYSGSCNKKYRPSQNKFGKVFYHDDSAVKVGCKVVYGMPVNLFLEQEEHSSFNGTKRYRITQRRYLSAIIEEEKMS